MRPRIGWLWLVAAVGTCAGSVRLEAADPEISVVLDPVRYIAVDGDAGAFREHHWMKDGYVGGVSHYSGKYDFEDGTSFALEGHALVDQNDLGTNLSLKKEGLGFVNLDFTEFRKYYDGKAGVFHRFHTFIAPDTDRELQLDIGKLALETGLTLEGWPELTFQYEHEHKNGTKSRLSWSEVEENVGGTDTTKNIYPGWQEIDEDVDIFTLGAKHNVAGFDLTGEQRWEFVRAENFRQEQDVSTTHGANDDIIRNQAQSPESTLMTTLLGAERSFQEGRTFLATAYHFAHMDNREFENLLQYDSITGVPGTGERKPGSRADNDYDAHTWVANSAFRLLESLNLTTNLKAEVIKAEGSSTYPDDDPVGPPIEQVELNLSHNSTKRWGEGVGLRFTGIPLTALYTELELEQARILLRERQSDTVASTVSFQRQTVADVRRGTLTLGGNVAPWRFLDVTAHVRHRRHNNDYDDQEETAFSSAFIDFQNIHTNEFMTRATYKPRRWLRSSIRYTYRDDDFSSAVQGQSMTKTGTLSHIYVYDVNLEPLPNLLLTGSFSRQTSSTKTLARYGAGNANVPTFNSNVNTWLFSATYTPRQDLTLTGTLQDSRARNFNDFTAIGLPQGGMPYGADFDQVDVTTELTWSPREDISISGEYGFYRYHPNSNWSTSDYDAHLIWLKVAKAF